MHKCDFRTNIDTISGLLKTYCEVKKSQTTRKCFYLEFLQIEVLYQNLK